MSIINVDKFSTKTKLLMRGLTMDKNSLQQYIIIGLTLLSMAIMGSAYINHAVDSLDQRVATLEADRIEDHSAIDRLAIAIDQQSQTIKQQNDITSTLATSVAKLQQVLDDRLPKK